MKVADLNFGDDVFTHVAADGTLTTYAAQAINDYIDAHPDEFEIMTTDVVECHVRQWTEEGAIEDERIVALVKQPQYLKRPIVFVAVPDGSVILIDGRHRYTLFFRLRQPKILIRVVPWDFAQRFVIEDYPIRSVDEVYDHSNILETRALRRLLEGK